MSLASWQSCWQDNRRYRHAAQSKAGDSGSKTVGSERGACCLVDTSWSLLIALQQSPPVIPRQISLDWYYLSQYCETTFM